MKANTQKILGVVGAVALGLVALHAMRKLLMENPADISGVTQTTKSGPSGALTTTPIKLGNVAFVAASSTLDTLAAIPARIFGVLSSVIPARTNAMQSNGNILSAASSLDTNRNQTAANYNPSAYAMIP